ncbi:MAG: alanine racemase, partial [Betaproteobacteria bacterium]
MNSVSDIDTPAAVVDIRRMQANIDRMQQRMNQLGVAFRPHVKTSKCLPVFERLLAAGARGLTVSQLKEAEPVFAAGITDILYAVGLVPGRLPLALARRRGGCVLTGSSDSVVAAQA